LTLVDRGVKVGQEY